MLNIGKLSPGAGEYYVGEVASSAEDYYTGRGEARGRWVGSLRVVLGLEGEVDPEQFRRLLAGKDPHSGEFLVTAQGSAGRAGARRAGPPPSSVIGEGWLDVTRAAVLLGVSSSYVRSLLAAGDRYQRAVAEAGAGEVVVEPRRYLVGERAGSPLGGGRGVWRVQRSEVERLVGDRPRPKARPGYDVTLRPPKAVSVLWALGDPKRRAAIRQAHAEAVDEVVRYLEDRAVFARVSDGGRRELRPTEGMVAAAFDHRTSRAGDPLLHTHVVVANMTRVQGPDGPVWRAIAAGGLFEHAKAAGHLYQAHLRHLLALRLGVEFGPVVNGYADVVGVPEAVVRRFSKRRTEIEQVLAESAATSARSAQVATLATRKPKGYTVDPDTLFDRWRAEATAEGFTAADLDACFDRSHPQPTVDDDDGRVFEVLAGPRGLTERASTFARSDVLVALTDRLTGSYPALDVERLADRFLGSHHAVVVDHAPPDPPAGDDEAGPPPRQRFGTQQRYTVADLVAMEDDVLGWAQHGFGTPTPAVAPAVVSTVLADRPELSAEQVAMVHTACAHRQAVLAVAGRPGAGKTYATEAIVAAHVVGGVKIFGCAVSATAAAQLETAAGFARSTTPATTVARLLLDLDRWEGLPAGSVVVVDESSMLSTRDLHRLLGHVGRAGGAVVLVGDPDQHGPVEVGGAFQRLCRDQGQALVRLVDNNRQVDHAERLAVEEYRNGHISEALARYDHDAKVIRSPTAGESFDAMVADWYAEHLEGRADPMIAGANSTRRALNERARTLLKANGELTGQPVVAAGREFLVGDLVVARRNDRRLRSHPGAGFVTNGSAGTVTAVHPDTGEVTVTFEQQGPIRLPRWYLAAGHLEHGYARTSYGVQGATHRTGRYHPTDQSSFEEGYVALTRARHGTRIYVVDGTITTTSDDEAHHRVDPQHFDLDEVAAALARRRSGTMASDHAGDLTTVHRLATRHTLGELDAARQPLRQVLATAPRDLSAVAAQTRADLDALHARRRPLQPTTAAAPTEADKRRVEAIDRAIARLERRLEVAQRHNAQRQAWVDQHAHLIARYDTLTRAAAQRRAKITADPERYLPANHPHPPGPQPPLRNQRQEQRRELVDEALRADQHTTRTTGDSQREAGLSPDL